MEKYKNKYILEHTPDPEKAALLLQQSKFDKNDFVELCCEFNGDQARRFLKGPVTSTRAAAAACVDSSVLESFSLDRRVAVCSAVLDNPHSSEAARLNVACYARDKGNVDLVRSSVQTLPLAYLYSHDLRRLVSGNWLEEYCLARAERPAADFEAVFVHDEDTKARGRAMARLLSGSFLEDGPSFDPYPLEEAAALAPHHGAILGYAASKTTPLTLELAQAVASTREAPEIFATQWRYRDMPSLSLDIFQALASSPDLYDTLRSSVASDEWLTPNVQHLYKEVLAHVDDVETGAVLQELLEQHPQALLPVADVVKVTAAFSLWADPKPSDNPRASRNHTWWLTRSLPTLATSLIVSADGPIPSDTLVELLASSILDVKTRNSTVLSWAAGSFERQPPVPGQPTRFLQEVRKRLPEEDFRRLAAAFFTKEVNVEWVDDELVSEVPEAPLSWASNTYAVNRFVGRYLSRHLELEEWQLALSLFDDWTGSLPELVEVVRATFGRVVEDPPEEPSVEEDLEDPEDESSLAQEGQLELTLFKL